MALTREQVLACEAAKRLLADPHLAAIIDRIAHTASERALFLPNPADRETNRAVVVALECIRQELRGDAEMVEGDTRAEILARNME